MIDTRISGALAAVDNLIREEEVTVLLMDLVRIASVNPPGGEGEVASYLAKQCASLGLVAEVPEVLPGRPNFLGTLRGHPGGKRLIFNTHLDVVPPGQGWSRDPFDPYREKNQIYGRGASDPKGSMAAMLHAIQAIRRAGITLGGDVVFTGAMDEEVGSLGTRAMVDSVRADMAVVGEPTACQICVAHKGSSRPVIVVYGHSAHAAEPEQGTNAILDATPVLVKLDRYARALRERRHRLLDSPTACVTMIRGGTKSNMVPDRCEIIVDRRLIPGETQEQVRAEVDEILQDARQANPHLQAKIERFDPTTGGPSETEVSHPLVQAALQALSEVRNFEAQPAGFTLNCDMTIFRERGVPTIIFGPGDPKVAHQADEFVPVDELIIAARTYSRLMVTTLGIS